MRRFAVVLVLVVLGQTAALAQAGRWEPWVRLPLVVDIAGPRSDGGFVATAGGRLYLVTAGRVRPFAPGYSTIAGTEPYIAMAGAGCFHRDTVYALDVRKPFGLVRIDPDGRPSRFAEFTGVETLSGITFDTTGSFGYRLLVTAAHAGKTVAEAVDCGGKVTVITKTAPVVEGGIAVAPASFGPHGGKLIAPDERSGNVIAVGADGSSSVVVPSGLKAGGDIGVEGVGFVPEGFSGAAYLADRSSPNSPTKGTNAILTLTADTLHRAGVRGGDLLVATEAVGRTIAVHCTTTCRVINVAQASAAAHPEGHILFAARMPRAAGHTARWLIALVLVVIAAALALTTVRVRRARSP